MEAIPIGGRVLLWRKGKYVYAIIYVHAEHGGRELAKHVGKEVEGIVVVKGKKEIDAETAAPSGAEPPQHDPMNEPYNAFIYQLYRRLAKIRAEHDPCNSPRAKIIGDKQYIAFNLYKLKKPLYSDRRMAVSEPITMREARSRLTVRYSVAEAKQILEHFAVPAEVRLLGKNYYILIECERVEEVFTALRSIVASNISDTTI